MTDYLEFTCDLSDPQVLSMLDEVSLWSAAFGMLLLEYLPLKSNQTVLDIGCGTGFPLLELAQRGGDSTFVVGIDPWQAAIAKVKQKIQFLKLTHAAVIVGDAADLPFNSEKFDLIVSNLGVNNFKNPPAVFAECCRTLKFKARLILTTNLRGHFREFYQIYADTLTALGRDEWLFKLQTHIDHRVSLEQVHSLLESVGLRIVKQHQQTFYQRFVNGSALLRHYFIKIGFLDGWKSIIPSNEQKVFFQKLEERLNDFATSKGELKLTIPMLYVEAEKNQEP